MFKLDINSRNSIIISCISTIVRQILEFGLCVKIAHETELGNFVLHDLQGAIRCVVILCEIKGKISNSLTILSQMRILINHEQHISLFFF